MKINNWAQAKIPVDIISKNRGSLGEILVAKTSIKDEEKLKGLAIQLVKEKTLLASVELTAELVYSNNLTESIKELERIVVTYTGLDGWCGGCLKLKEEIKSVKETVNQLENEIKVMKELNELMIVVGQLIGTTYRILFDIAIEKYCMPKQINRDGKLILVDIPLFLKLSHKNGLFRQYLILALREKDITMNDYDTLVAAKRTRNESFHSYEPSQVLVDTLELSNVHDPVLEKAKEVLLKHRTLFATEDEYSLIDD